MSDTELQNVVDQAEEQIIEDANAPKKNAVAAEPTPLSNEADDLGAAVVKPDDATSGPSKAGDKSKQVKDQVNKDANDGSNPAGQGDFKPGKSLKEEEVESDDEVVAEDTETEIDLSKDVEALVSADADLSEEFVKEELVEKVESYLNYVVEEWIKDNQLAVDKGIRSEIAEDFISGLKTLFKEHYIDVPEEKYDVLEAMAQEKEELEKKLNEEIAKNVEISKSNLSFSKEKIFSEASNGLADTEAEKLKDLAENIEFKDEKDFSMKLDTIKESYFAKNNSEATTAKADVDSVVGDATLTSGSNQAMAAYTAAISNTLTKVKV